MTGATASSREASARHNTWQHIARIVFSTVMTFSKSFHHTMRRTVLQKPYDALYPILTPGRVNRNSTCWYETHSLLLNKKDECREQLPNIEGRRGAFGVRDRIKNPQP